MANLRIGHLLAPLLRLRRGSAGFDCISFDECWSRLDTDSEPPLVLRLRSWLVLELHGTNVGFFLDRDNCLLYLLDSTSIICTRIMRSPFVKHSKLVPVVFLVTLFILVTVLSGPLSTSAATNGSEQAGFSTRPATAAEMNAAVLLPRLAHWNSTLGVVQTTTYTATLYNGTQIDVPASESQQSSGPQSCGSFHLYCRPYIGGYMTGSGCGNPPTYCIATEARVAIGFPGTSHNVIPSGNFLEGTISLKGADCCTHGVDYLIRAAHVLYPSGNHGLVADFWKTCEGLLYGCGLPGAWELMAYVLVITGLSDSQQIYVKIQTTSTAINWLYSYDGANWYQVTSWTPPSSFNHDLQIGTNNIQSPPYYTAFYYQFGVWAQSAFTGAFTVSIINPSYYRNGAWTAVPRAFSMYGPDSFFDETWNLASNTWGLCSAPPYPGTYFYLWYQSGCTLGEVVRLWG